MRPVFLGGLSMAVLGATGCQLIGLFFHSDKEVKAEYPFLAQKRICLIVRADLETQSMYPHVQFEIADHVRGELEANIRPVTVIDPRKVVDFQRADPSWETLDPAAIGKRFGADRVLEIDLTQYTTREPENEYLYRGHIAAAIRIYQVEYPNSKPSYKAQVQVAYPERGGQWGMDERSIRAASMELFAHEVAGKFFDHTVKEG